MRSCVGKHFFCEFVPADLTHITNGDKRCVIKMYNENKYYKNLNIIEPIFEVESFKIQLLLSSCAKDVSHTPHFEIYEFITKRRLALVCTNIEIALEIFIYFSIYCESNFSRLQFIKKTISVQLRNLVFNFSNYFDKKLSNLIIILR